MTEGEQIAPIDGGKSPLRPGLALGAPPPFHELDEYTFQELCREIVAEEPLVSTCEVYGKRGEGQHGIDLLAQRRANDGIEVAQCKCYEDFQPAKIAAASDEFLEHWVDRWSAQSVKRFILIVACDLTHTKRQAEILTQKQRFKDLGVVYEAWSARTIQTKLRPHPAIVSRYLRHEFWVREICGPAAPASHWASPVGAHVAHGVAGDLIAQLSAAVGRELEHVRAHLREGRYDDAAKWLETGLTPEALRALPVQLQAKILRLRASIVLELREEVTRGRALSQQADALDPAGAEGARLRAVLALFERGPQGALSVLGEPVDIDGLNLRSALLIEAGDQGQAEALLARLAEEGKANHETSRLRTYLALARGDLDNAQKHVAQANEAAPHRESVRVMLIAVKYAQALCTFSRDEVLPWPRPIEWWQVRRDDASLALLDEAGGIATELLGRFTLAGSPRRILETWRIACLANHPERQDEARDFVSDVLRRDPGHTRLIAWAFARSIEVPSECRTTLEELVEAGTAEPHHVLALLNIYVGKGLLPEAERLHVSTRGLLESQGALSVWERWRILLLLERGQTEELRSAVDAFVGPLSTELRLLASDREARAKLAVRDLEQARVTSTRPQLLFELCRAAAAGDEWTEVARWADVLTEAIPTPDAIQMAAMSLFRTRAYESCISLVRRSGARFPHERLPVFLRQILSRCLAAVGGLPAAAHEAAQLSRDQPTTENLLALVDLHRRLGDLAAAAVEARKLLGAPDLTPEQSLELARTVQVHDRALAVRFWRQAAGSAVPDEMVSALVELGHRLGEPEDAPLLETLGARLTALGREGRAGVVFVDTEEQLLAFVQAARTSNAHAGRVYRCGEAPLHVVLPRFNVGWARFFEATTSENESANTFAQRRAIYLRHGARPRLLPLGAPGAAPSLLERRLNLDISSLLILENLGLLERVLYAFRAVRVAQETIPLLVAERTATLGADHGRLGALIDKLRVLVQDGRLLHLPVAAMDDEDDEQAGTFEHVSIRCLMSLLRMVPESQDVIAIDDRFLTRYSHHQGAPVVGVLELLDALELDGRLTLEERFSAIGRLRRWNARHLALDAQELLRLVNGAPVVDDELEETADLRVLRSYVASSLLDTGVLQYPPMPPNSPNPTGEIEYVMSFHRATHEVLLAVFEAAPEHADARADWLLEWLYPSLLLMAHANGRENTVRADADELTVIGLCELITLPLTKITMDIALAEPSAQRVGFVRWLENVVESHFSAQPALRRRVWDAVRAHVGALLRHGEGREARIASQLMARTFLRSLPSSLRDLAGRDEEFLAQHGLEVTRTLTVHGVSFTDGSFHAAVVEAVNGRPASATLAGEEAKVDFARSIVDGRIELTFTPPAQGAQQVRLYDPAFGMASDDVGLRARSLSELRRALGLTTDSFAEIELQLQRASSAIARMHHFRELWDRSAEAFYASFMQQCVRHENFGFREMRPPDAPQALTFFGLATEWAGLDAVANTLVERHGLRTAVHRLTGLPCALPTSVRAAFLALEVGARAGFLQQLRESARSFLDGIRLLELATAGDLLGHPEHSDLGTAVLDLLLSDEGSQQFEALEALLLWTSSDFLRWPDTSAWPTTTRLAIIWMHSHQMLRCLLSGQADPVPLARSVRAATHLAPSEIFGQDHEYGRDVAHPRGVEWPTFLASALGVALQGSPNPWWTDAAVRIQDALLVTRDEVGPRSLHPHFLLDTSLASNQLGSFLQADWSDVLGRLLGVDDPAITSGLGRATLRNHRTSSLETLVGRPDDIEAWTYVFGICRDYGIDGDLAPRLADILTSVDLTALSNAPCGYRMPLAVMQNFVSCFRDRRVAAAMETQLIQLAAALARGPRDENRARQDQLALLGAAHALSAAEPNQSQAVEIFARVMGRLADVDHTLLDAAAPLVLRLWRWLPGSSLVRLVPLLLRLRRDAHWNPPAQEQAAANNVGGTG